MEDMIWVQSCLEQAEKEGDTEMLVIFTEILDSISGY